MIARGHHHGDPGRHGEPSDISDSLGRHRRSAISRRLSFVLRHAPRSIGLTLAPGGWVEVDALLAGLRASGLALSRADLELVVATNDKQRFAFDESGTRIRASQGHSVPVDLGLPPVQPPPVLFHGTVAANLDAIRRQGLTRRGRHHVHLCADRRTAQAVGARRGPPVILRIDSAAMAADGASFFRSDNGVWLVAAVPPQYLTELEREDGASSARTELDRETPSFERDQPANRGPNPPG